MSERQVERKVNVRKQIDPRDSFDWSTPNLNVSARPTDNYNPSTGVSSGTLQLAKALGVISEAAVSYGQYREQKNKDEEEKGRLSRGKGEALAENSTASFVRGWESLDGELQSQDFEAKSSEYLEQHKDEDSVAFKQGYDQFTKDYISQLASDNAVKGFLSKGLQVEDGVYSAYHKYQQKAVKAESIAKVSSLMNNDFDSFLRTTLGVTNVEAILTDPKTYLKYYQNKEEFAKKLQAKFKGYTEGVTDKYKGLVSKDEVETIFYSLLKAKSEYLDIPELMDLMDNKDANGIAKKDLLGTQEEVYQTRERALSGQSSRLSSIDKERQQDLTNYINLKSNYYYQSISALGDNDVAGAKRILAELNKDSLFRSNGKWDELYKSLYEILHSQGFPKKSDNPTYYSLEDKRHRGTLTFKDIMVNRYNLSKVDFEDFRNFLEAESRRQQEEAEKKKKQTSSSSTDKEWYNHNKEMSVHYSALMDGVKRFNKFNMWINPDECYQAQDYLGGLINEFKVKNKREPVGSEWRAIEDEFHRKFPPGIGGMKSNPPQQPAQQNNKPVTPTQPSKPQQQQKKPQASKPPVKVNVPKGYKDTGRVDAKTGRKVYQKPNGDYVILN